MQEARIENIDTVILGAGLAGLSAARAGSGVVFEKQDEIGGTCRSSKTDGYTFDLGIHVLHTRNNHVLNLLSKDKNIGLKRKRRSAWIYSHRLLTKYPFQVNTFGLPSDIVSQCLTGFIDALKRPKEDYHNYQDWIYAIFGRGIADNFYLPYSEKFWTIKAKELTTDWLGPRVPRPQLKDVIQGAFSVQKKEFGPNALFRYPGRGGIQRVAQALCGRSARVALCKETVKVELDKKLLHFSDCTVVRYNKLISTIPLTELSAILDNSPKRVKEAVRDLRYNSVLCVNLGIKREKITSRHWIYFPEAEYAAFRISFPANFSSFTVPRKWSSVQAEISYSRAKPIRHRDIVRKVIQDLIRARVIKPKDRVRLINTQDIKYAYVIHDHNRLNNLKVINKFLRSKSVYNAGRYGKWEYQWMDDAILDGRRAAQEAGRR
ncbi:protoporphyrinogen/coproporphyrinogen oxidase [Candidatus Omnitrophota bacterium]